MMQSRRNSDQALNAFDPLVVLAEFQHRVANEYTLAISSIELVARNCKGRAKDTLTQVVARLHDYALSHRALLPPQVEGPLDLSPYLRKICQLLTRASLAERGISITLSETSVDLDAWQAWRVALIVSELVFNSIRHGVWPVGGGAIRVEIAADDFEIRCSVIDNGRGFKGRSLGKGTRIVDWLAVELGGSVSREFDNEGAAAILTFARTPASESDFDRARYA
jgi:two-component sensor histidine kinase